jgi:hypothetical protein
MKKLEYTISEFLSLMIGIIIGFLLYLKFYYYKKIHAINSAKIKSRIYEIDNRKYMLKPEIYLCPC